VKGNVVQKLLNFVGIEEIDDYADSRDQEWEPEAPKKVKKPPVVSLAGGQRGGAGVRVVVMHPRSLEDGQTIADQVKGRRPVIVNLDLADERSGQRLLNFLSGVVYALDGSLRKVGDGIFLATPSNVEVAADDQEETNWVRAFGK
jgi:cell division inhibitor SepF